VARMGEVRKCTRFWWESPKQRDHSEDRGIDGRIKSVCILGRLSWECGVDSVGSGQGPVAARCEREMNLRVLAPRS
jgi:hypothetical protein